MNRPSLSRLPVSASIGSVCPMIRSGSLRSRRCIPNPEGEVHEAMAGNSEAREERATNVHAGGR